MFARKQVEEAYGELEKEMAVLREEGWRPHLLAAEVLFPAQAASWRST